MPSMPYVVTQGDICTALENAYNFGHPKAGVVRSAAKTRLDALADLKSGVAVGSCGGILSDPIATHIDEHWFGLSPARTPLSSTGPTGWWINWSGPAEEIARQGLILALEVSLGLNPEEECVDAATVEKVHPLDFSWICPVPRFEFWIGWRDLSSIVAGPHDGIVTVTMATPGYGNYFDPDPPSGIPDHKPLTAVLDPVLGPAPYPSNGHVVVGSKSTASAVWEYDIPGTGNGLGNPWKILLGAGSQGTDQVVAHAPAAEDGIAASGIPNPVVMT